MKVEEKSITQPEKSKATEIFSYLHAKLSIFINRRRFLKDINFYLFIYLE